MHPRSHPAFRKRGTLKELPNPQIYDDNEIAPLIRELAEVAMSCETPGVAEDHLVDELIGIARKWVAREKLSAKFIAELD